MKKIVTRMAPVMLAASAIAHPGHNEHVADASTGLLHYLTSPVHMIPATAVVVLTAYVIRRIAVARSRHHDK